MVSAYQYDLLVSYRSISLKSIIDKKQNLNSNHTNRISTITISKRRAHGIELPGLFGGCFDSYRNLWMALTDTMWYSSKQSGQSDSPRAKQRIVYLLPVTMLH